MLKNMNNDRGLRLIGFFISVFIVQGIPIQVFTFSI